MVPNKTSVEMMNCKRSFYEVHVFINEFIARMLLHVQSLVRPDDSGFINAGRKEKG